MATEDFSPAGPTPAAKSCIFCWRRGKLTNEHVIHGGLNQVSTPIAPRVCDVRCIEGADPNAGNQRQRVLTSGVLLSGDSSAPPVQDVPHEGADVPTVSARRRVR